MVSICLQFVKICFHNTLLSRMTILKNIDVFVKLYILQNTLSISVTPIICYSFLFDTMLLVNNVRISTNNSQNKILRRISDKVLFMPQITHQVFL